MAEEKSAEIENSGEVENSVEVEVSNETEDTKESNKAENSNESEKIGKNEVANEIEESGENENGTSDEIENQNITYILKILNGPHVGAEVSLSDKIWVIGRSDTCDIALLDETLKEQHAKFSLRDGKVFCEPFEGATYSIFFLFSSFKSNK